MAHLHLKINSVVEDTEGDGSNVRPRIRVQFTEFKPRSGHINLKNATLQQINQFKKLVGGDAMVPIREGMMNGQTFFQFLHVDDIIPIHEPENLVASLVSGSKDDDVKDKKNLDFSVKRVP
jgi:hypothetical protein